MKPSIVLVISVAYLTMALIAVLSFLFMPSVLQPSDWVERLIFVIFVSGVWFLFWLSAKIIGRNRFAWYLGAVIYGLFAVLELCWLVVIDINLVYVQRAVPSVDPTYHLASMLFKALILLAYLLLYFSPGVRRLFRAANETGKQET